MNFQRIVPVDNAEMLLDVVFRKAGEKKVAAAKFDLIVAQLQNRLGRVVKDFPSYDGVPVFYHKLMRLTLDIDKYKKALGSVQWAVGRVKALHREYRKKLSSEGRREHKLILKQFYGRVSSVIHRIDFAFVHLAQVRRTLKTYPDIKEMFTLCLYGFPNVGKSTLLNTITGTKAKTAAYAFTTKTINAGYFFVGEEKIQVLDVPGTLARPDKMNLIEQQADLVVEEVADVIVFVFDVSELCGYSVAEQLQLYEKAKQFGKEVFVFVSKKDMLSNEQVKAVSLEHYSLEEIYSIVGERLVAWKAAREVEQEDAEQT